MKHEPQATAASFPDESLKSLRSDLVLTIQEPLVDSPIHVEFRVPSGDLDSAIALRRRFDEQAIAAHVDAIPVDSKEQHQIRLATCFLQFITLQVKATKCEGQHAPLDLLLAVILKQYCTQFLKGANVHAATESFPTLLRQYVIDVFYLSVSWVRQWRPHSKGVDLDPLPANADCFAAPKPYLLQAASNGQAPLMAVFRGQGGDSCLQELIDTVHTYSAFADAFVRPMATILSQHALDPLASEYYPQGLDLMRWIQAPESHPAPDYLISAPVSLPMIGLTQLFHYYVLFKALDLSPNALKSHFIGTTGHSQGIISAVVIGASDTEDEFLQNSRRALLLLSWIGIRSQQIFPVTSLKASLLKEALELDSGMPSPMLSVANVPGDVLAVVVHELNLRLGADRQISVALSNGPRAFTCSGHPQSLHVLNQSLSKLKAKPGQDDSRIPFHKRRLKLLTKFLPVTVPFHSVALGEAVALIAEDIERFDLSFATPTLPVLSTEDGADLRASDNLALALAELICSKAAHWTTPSLFVGASYLLDFGPGGAAGIAALTQRNLEGTGTAVIVMGTLDAALLTKTDFFRADGSRLPPLCDWKRDFAPKLRRTSDGHLQLETRFSRVVGKPPLMVAGMTPTTANAGFVAATINAGYHVELAGGGHHTEDSLRRTIDDIVAQVAVGESITLNILYLNPKQWAFQFPLALRLKQEGVPIGGVCVAAGVPSPDAAVAIVTAMRDAGLRHVAFKPGSVDAIHQVVQIAGACPDFPIVLQWTGGRAGGHHGFEDLHQPLLETYAIIRRHGNLVLVLGSGIGDADDSLPYLTGDWSVPYGYPPMPVDGLLMGSRLLVAKEARTSPGAKDCIVAAAGVDDERQWVQTYDQVAGGVVTVTSELGEPIHKVATRGVLLWKELDTTLFRLPTAERLIALRRRKADLIRRLNADFQKPWFGRKADGTVADLAQMTYREVVERLVTLLFIRHKGRGWIHASYRTIVFEFVRRLQERLGAASGAAPSLASPDDLLQPDRPLAALFAAVPAASTQLLTSDDVAFFVALCQRRGLKPVPFIPVLDERFETWFKKDSLWQAEDVDAVPDQDAGRVCILQGPVAAKYSRTKDEPVAQILDSIVAGYVDGLVDRSYEGDAKRVPLGAPETASVTVPAGVRVDVDSDSVTYTIADDLPPHDQWLQLLGGSSPSWLRSLLTAATIVQGRRATPNRFPAVFGPRPRLSVRIRTETDGMPRSVELLERGLVWVRASLTQPQLVSVSLFADGPDGRPELPLQYVYEARNHLSPLHEVLEGRNDRIKQFYYRLWIEDAPMPEVAPTPAAPVVLAPGPIAAYCRCVGLPAGMYGDGGAAPIDYAIVAAWKTIITTLFSSAIDADLLRLVHLSNRFEMLDTTSAEGLRVGDRVTSGAEIVAVRNVDAGKTLTVRCVVERDGRPLVAVLSRFLYRGSYHDFGDTFEHIIHDPIAMTLDTAVDVARLESRPWFVPSAASTTPLAPGATLVFALRSYYEFADAVAYSKVITTGTVTLQVASQPPVAWAAVQYERLGVSYGDPVVDYVTRYGSVRDAAHRFAGDGHAVLAPDGSGFGRRFTAPPRNDDYARLSGDRNPIHVNPYVVAFADLPARITHGMWTSAATRACVDVLAADHRPGAVRTYDVDFVAMVMPGDRLETRLAHIGMDQGLKLIQIETRNSDGDVVVKGVARVAQPPTAFVFTGQGSQARRMGMDLYDASPVARRIWDRADRHFRDQYGVSILEIVRDDPLELTVHFGNRLGARIRRNYQSLMVDTILADGSVVKTSLFPDITDHSDSYTFRSPSGLLSSTQFTQPALTLMEKAAFEDLKAHGLVPDACVFAGHSLGEYSALASVADILSIEALVDVVFYRGLSMQTAVPRDRHGRSNYGMVAVNPTRVGFGERELVAVVQAIVAADPGLLEIVNYNVDGQQYVVAGDVVSLEVLKEVLNGLRAGTFHLATLPLAAVFAGVRARCDPGTAFVALERGCASIPLPGIDVPFHSRFLKSGVPAFRQYLASRIHESQIDLALLRHRYIPNVVARPFDIDRAYFELVHERTQSEALGQALDDWVDEAAQSAQHQRRLGRLLLIELLAFQFASPVLWIETQAQLFGELDIARLIEIGPSPVLSGMAQRTLTAKFADLDAARCLQRSVLCYTRDRDQIYYQMANVVADAVVKPESPPLSDSPPKVESPPLPVVSAPVATPAVIPEVPITAREILHCVVAHKLRRPCGDVALRQSVKELVGGKSTLQNEIMGDLAKEFGADAVPDRSEEQPLQVLAQFLQPTHTGALGSVSGALVNKLLSGRFPAGFGLKAFQTMVATVYGLGPQRADGVLLHAVTMEPAQRLASDADVRQWLATVITSYGRVNDVVVTPATASPATSPSPQTVVVQSAELVERQMRMDALIRTQLDAHAVYLGLDLRHAHHQLEAEQGLHRDALSEVDFWTQEHGAAYADGIRPICDRLKIRRYDSAWNWALQDAFELLAAVRATQSVTVAADLLDRLRNRAGPRLRRFLQDGLAQVLAPDQRQALAAALQPVIEAAPDAKPLYRKDAIFMCPQVTVSEAGDVVYGEEPRSGLRSIRDYVDEMRDTSLLGLESRSPLQASQWAPDPILTATYFDVLDAMADGLSFRAKNILVTGCGAGSIGADLVRALLAGGARVVVTTSRQSARVQAHFRALYEQYGASGASLTVVPCNLASRTDVDALVDCIYDVGAKKGLDLDLDMIVPFAALGENGRSLMNIDGRAELAHRLMLTNLYRLLGRVAAHKQRLAQRTRPAVVLLPLSPNHGAFGHDGLYGETKAGLAALLNRWESEDWSDYLSVIGAVIGWTRGTALMADNDLVAHGIEERGARTFSATEMTLNLIALLHPSIVRLSQQAPIVADLSGGLRRLPNLKAILTDLRQSLTTSAAVRAGVRAEDQHAARIVQGPAPATPAPITPRANLRFDFPPLPTGDDLDALEHLRDLLDLDRVVVVTGFGEVGPYGNARTRWQMEADGQFSLEGCLELAWIMGYIKFVADRRLNDGTLYSGWVDVASDEPVPDCDVKRRYEERILAHTGIRLIEPELFGGWRPERKTLLQEVVFAADMPPFECGRDEADAFRRQHGAHVDVRPVDGSETQCQVRLRKGATLYVPKALRFDRLVAGQIPTGWDAGRYGVPKDIIDQVDPVTLYVLVATVDALVSSGITDPYEFYQYVHVSAVGNTCGGGIGGMHALRGLFRDRFLDRQVQKDVLQESFINTMPAWINLLLLSSAGPIKSPVGACATAVQSVEIGVDTLLSGKAKIVVCGGYDDFAEESSQEFANIGATSNSLDEIAHGREPREMSRPATDTRAGFMEAHGAGVHVLMTAKVAVEMGVPIYGIIAHTATAMDKVGRSVPAPGQGILTTAREAPSARPSRLLDLEFRAERLRSARRQIKERTDADLRAVLIEAESCPAAERAQFIQDETARVRAQSERDLKQAVALWSHDFAKDNPCIAPLRAALAVYGLTVDDIDVASFHGTGTKANDVNESDVVDRQLRHLGRRPGNLIPSIFQKYLTGHPKGAAAAWMLNGVLNVIGSGVIPGNRNADNIDPALADLDYVFYPSRRLVTGGVRAALLKSFGFGQVGGECLVVHPKYVLAALDPSELKRYRARRDARQHRIYRYMHDSLTGAAPYVQLKERPPYTPAQESAVYLDPNARTRYDHDQRTWTFASYETKAPALDNMFQDLLGEGGARAGIGCDNEWLASFPAPRTEFVARNFTPLEIAYCEARPDPKASFAGRWCAKEAVLKAITDFAAKRHDAGGALWDRGAAAPLIDIEIAPSASGAPQVRLHGAVLDVAAGVGVRTVNVSISHSDVLAQAAAVAF